MAEALMEQGHDLESTTVKIYRTAAVVKGGRRFSFGALVVVGDRRGSVGIGYGKAPGVPAAIEKAQKAARKNLVKVSLLKGTIPHEINATFGASKVRMLPAAPGTGVIAGGTVRAVLELAGVKDCLTKAYGSTNEKNLSRAALAGLSSLRTKETIATLRGVDLGETEVEQRLTAGEKYAPQVSSESAPARGPENVVKSGRGGGKGGNRGGRGGGGGGRGGRDNATASTPTPSPEAAAPAASEGAAPAGDAPSPEATPES